MNENTKIRLTFWFTLLYVSFFSIFAILRGNYEFIFYTVIMSVLIFIIIRIYKKLHLTSYILGGLALLGILHVLGGNVHIFDTRLYEFWLIDGVLKYDNMVHAFGIYVITFICYSLVYPHLDKKAKHNYVLLSVVLITSAIGFGALNEVIELMAVLFLGAAKQVGDYFNNAFDLLFNFIGASAACVFIIRYHKKQRN